MKISVVSKLHPIPYPIMSFDVLGGKPWIIDKNILKNIADLSYAVPTAVQSQAIPIMLQVSLVFNNEIK